MTIDLKPCIKCGNQPKEYLPRIAEDCVGVIFACDCGHSGEQVEDTFVDGGMRLDAARSWNIAN